jgi:hypothetical protein
MGSGPSSSRALLLLKRADGAHVPRKQIACRSQGLVALEPRQMGRRARGQQPSFNFPTMRSGPHSAWARRLAFWASNFNFAARPMTDASVRRSRWAMVRQVSPRARSSTSLPSPADVQGRCDGMETAIVRGLQAGGSPNTRKGSPC